MTSHIRRLLEKQAEWQHGRRASPWVEKLRLSVVMRKTLMALRKRTAT